MKIEFGDSKKIIEKEETISLLPQKNKNEKILNNIFTLEKMFEGINIDNINFQIYLNGIYKDKEIPDYIKQIISNKKD